MRDNPKVASKRVAGTLRVATVRIAFLINHRPFQLTFLSVARLSTWRRLVTALAGSDWLYRHDRHIDPCFRTARLALSRLSRRCFVTV